MVELPAKRFECNRCLYCLYCLHCRMPAGWAARGRSNVARPDVSSKLSVKGVPLGSVPQYRSFPGVGTRQGSGVQRPVSQNASQRWYLETQELSVSSGTIAAVSALLSYARVSTADQTLDRRRDSRPPDGRSQRRRVLPGVDGPTPLRARSPTGPSLPPRWMRSGRAIPPSCGGSTA